MTSTSTTCSILDRMLDAKYWVERDSIKRDFIIMPLKQGQLRQLENRNVPTFRRAQVVAFRSSNSK